MMVMMTIPSQPVRDKRFHEISLNKTPPRCLYCRGVSPPATIFIK